MKKKLYFILIILLVLIGLTFCVKEDPTLVSEEVASKNADDENSPAKEHLAAITLLRVFSITCVSARVEGQIIDLGDVGGEMATHGVCWSTNPNPTLFDNKTRGGVVCSNCLGSHTRDDLIGLNSGTTYYVRAYTKNSTDTSYSNQLTFNTNSTVKLSITAAIFPLSLSCTGVIVAFDITDDGGNGYITEKGVCYATTLNPTTEDNKGCNEYYDMIIDDKIYHCNSWIQYLQPATLYHVRPYFITNAGTFYGEDISFTTNSKPAIITTGVTDITRTTAKVIGNITSTGGSFVVERGVCFDTIPNLETVIMRGGFGLASHFIEQEVQSVNGAGEFTVSMTNLNHGTRYYVSTFVGVMDGFGYGDQVIGYGNEVSFTTKP